jgi:hypothetical protein
VSERTATVDTLAYVYLTDGTFVNAEMVRQGYGHAYTQFPSRISRSSRVSPIVPAVDRSDATSVQRGLTALTKRQIHQRYDARDIPTDSARHRKPNLASPVIPRSRGDRYPYRCRQFINVGRSRAAVLCGVPQCRFVTEVHEPTSEHQSYR